MRRSWLSVWLLAVGAASACSGTDGAATADGRRVDGGGAASGAGGATDGGEGGPSPNGDGGIDLGDAESPDGHVVIDKCHVPPDETSGDAPTCEKPPAPPNAFTPKSKWTWTAPGGVGSFTTPLVANLTDDNGDGAIDLCDVPDVIVTTGIGFASTGSQLFMLAGDTGALELTFEGAVDGSVNPALGDVDGDGLPEVVAADPAGHIVIYDHAGKLQTVGPDVGAWLTEINQYCTAIAIYDLDADGVPEIIAGFEVFDHTGTRRFGQVQAAYQGYYWCPANTAADLDGDGKLEVIFGNAAYHADGQLYWQIAGPPGQPQVANLDDDPEPEILIARQDGLLILEHDGAVKLGPYKPFAEPDSPNCWSKPAAIHDFDGDGHADIVASACQNYGVMRLGGAGLSLLWSASVNDTSGLASSTGFDFLGRGVAEAVYGDQVALYVYDGVTGQLQFSEPRSSGTLIEYPVVADIDNDQSADILVVSNDQVDPSQFHSTIQAFEDAEKRWIPTRRIWNQHAYHVTNVREDGTIPKVMAKSWTKLNTFRTNAQIENGGDCAPPPANPR
ncbi:MAG: VCBS repeat-containing protein [Sorangiineae bacterium]|nr:VCBS repeat-containing protein [Polyangiaceae bacterium]MEB2323703.1 VCBS repeat-containing protein [Sorangiineae bacterium]